MRRWIWIGVVLIVATSILAVRLLIGNVQPPSKEGFRLIFSIEWEVLLLSTLFYPERQNKRTGCN